MSSIIVSMCLLISIASSTEMVHAGDAITSHVPKPINIEVDVREAETEVFLLIDETLFTHWLSLDPKEIEDLDPDLKEDWGDYGNRVVEWLDLHAPVQVDGVQLIPVLTDLEYQEGFDLNDLMNFAAITVTYPTKARPRQLDFIWSRFDTEDGFPLESVYYVLSTRDDYQVYRFQEDTPGWSWSPPDVEKMIDPDLVAPGIRLPWFTLDLLPILFSIIGLRIVWRAKKFSRATVVVALICVALAAATLGTSKVEVRPFWLSPVQLPPPEQAEALFESLHRNIYRAFDYEDEHQIYRLLKRSVSGQLLQQIYDEIHESLMMRIEEDAICDVRAVRSLDTEVIVIKTVVDPMFQVRARWEVIGTVKHWGHTHWRKNLSTALYDVRWIPDSGWRIDGVDVVEQRRLDDGQELIK
jgi:hypothetical protein